MLNSSNYIAINELLLQFEVPTVSGDVLDVVCLAGKDPEEIRTRLCEAVWEGNDRRVQLYASCWHISQALRDEDFRIEFLDLVADLFPRYRHRFWGKREE